MGDARIADAVRRWVPRYWRVVNRDDLIARVGAPCATQHAGRVVRLSEAQSLLLVAPSGLELLWDPAATAGGRCVAGACVAAAACPVGVASLVGAVALSVALLKWHGGGGGDGDEPDLRVLFIVLAAVAYVLACTFFCCAWGLCRGWRRQVTRGGPAAALVAHKIILYQHALDAAARALGAPRGALDGYTPPPAPALPLEGCACYGCCRCCCAPTDGAEY